MFGFQWDLYLKTQNAAIRAAVDAALKVGLRQRAHVPGCSFMNLVGERRRKLLINNKTYMLIPKKSYN
jgi:hypothetical protein